MGKISAIKGMAPKLAKRGTIRLGVRESGSIKEVDYFIIDIEDIALKEKALSTYGTNPRELDITFYTDSVEEIFRHSFQLWGSSQKGTPALKCEGDGEKAIEYTPGTDVEKDKVCPCEKYPKYCRKTGALKFLLPKLTMGGYFTMTTRSDHNIKIIKTVLDLVLRATGGLMLRPLKLKRVAGRVNINGIITKKYFVEIVWDQGIDEIGSEVVKLPILTESFPLIDSNYGDNIADNIVEVKDSEVAWDALTGNEETKLALDKVTEKVKIKVRGPFINNAVEVYACERFGVGSTSGLRIDDLRRLWKEVESEDVIRKIWDMATRMFQENRVGQGERKNAAG